MAPKQYSAIQFITSPYWTTEKFIIVPSTWILYENNETVVAFPMLGVKKLFSYVMRKKSPCKNWAKYPITVEYKADDYDHVALYIELRQKMRSQYVTRTAKDIQVVDMQQSTVETASALSSTGDISEVTKSEITRRAIEDNLIARISNGISEVDILLDCYKEMTSKNS